MADDALVIDRASVDEALTWPERARAVVIATADAYVLAAELTKGIKALRARIAETFDPHIQRAHQAHKALVAEKAAAERPLTEAETVIKGKLIAYDAEQDRIRRAEERRLAEEARKAEEARRLDEAAAMEMDAIAAGDPGLQAEAEALISTPVLAPVISLPKATPKVDGISFRETWGGEVTDLLALVKHIAAHPEHLNLVAPNTTAINGLARSLRQSLNIPGIRAVASRQVASGR